MGTVSVCRRCSGCVRRAIVPRIPAPLAYLGNTKVLTQEGLNTTGSKVITQEGQKSAGCKVIIQKGCTGHQNGLSLFDFFFCVDFTRINLKSGITNKLKFNFMYVYINLHRLDYIRIVGYAGRK